MFQLMEINLSFSRLGPSALLHKKSGTVLCQCTRKLHFHCSHHHTHTSDYYAIEEIMPLRIPNSK